MSSPSIVIKVEFKTTRRRFIAFFEDEKLALNVVMLREKIRGFFSFDSGVEFSLTYVDEDGDDVTLVNDDDLLDIAQQPLDQLRITVKLNKSDPGVSSLTSKVPIMGAKAPLSRPYDSFLTVPPLSTPQALKDLESDVFGSKLNSGLCFDVNVPDGTIMAPSTKFTKIWRMWNSCRIEWPYGTQLQWVSGDWLGSSYFVNVQIPLFGLHVDMKCDIAVNFIAPERPGSYVSYWRLVYPFGHKFGQRVSVMIKVEDLSPAAVTSMSPLSDTIKIQNTLNSLPQSRLSPAAYYSVNPSTVVDSAPSSSSTVPAVQPLGSSSQYISADQEQKLLEDLEQMGFEQAELNREILRRNNYIIEKSINDLYWISEWDPMISELEEMALQMKMQTGSF